MSQTSEVSSDEGVPAQGPTDSQTPSDADAPLPVIELDKLLSPLRRVLVFAIRDEGRNVSGVRYLGVNGGRLVASALQLDLPQAVRELLADLAGNLADFDDLGPEDRLERLRAIYARLARIDALLGLPLQLAPSAGTRPDRASDRGAVRRGKRQRGRDKGRRGRRDDTTDESAEVPAQPPSEVRGGPRDERGRRKKGRGRAARAEEPAVEPDRTPEPAWPPGHPEHTGRALADLGVEDRLVSALTRAGVETLFDLLSLPPTGEDVIRPVHGAGRDLEPGRVAVGGRVQHRVSRLSPEGIRAEVVLQGAASLALRWSGPVPPWLLERLAPGERVVVVGEHRDGDGEVLHDPELAHDDGSHNVRLATYGIDGVEDRELRQIIERFIPEASRLRDPIPASVLERVKLPAIGEALAEVHRRGSARPDARARLAFGEALLAFAGMAVPRPGGASARERGISHSLMHGLATRMARVAEFELSDPQQVALEEIKRDLKRSAPMLRVLTGDVGAGRGLVALVTAAIVAESKGQVLFVSPDDASAEVRYTFAEPLLREVGLVARLVVGEPTRGQLDALRRGELHVLFGTKALLDTQLEFRRLALVISEERDVFGGSAPRVARMRAPRPDLLVLTSAPVPVEVLTSAYGGHDVSDMRDLDRAEVTATLYDANGRSQAYAEALAAVTSGRQAWVVFPMVRGADALDAREAMRMKSALESDVFAGARVGLLHGAMSREDRYRVYDDFRHHRCDVLMATTRFEDGPPVPAATVAVVEQADRIAPIRLRRIRAHLAKALWPGVHACHFVLGDVPDPEGVERVRAVVRGDDDRDLAELDVPPGGIEACLDPDVPRPPAFRWLDPRRDRHLLQHARVEARRLALDDPGLRRGNHSDLARVMRDRWDDLFSEPCPLPDAASAAATTGAKRRRRRRKRR